MNLILRKLKLVSWIIRERNCLLLFSKIAVIPQKQTIPGWIKTFLLQFVKLYNRYKRFKISTNHNWVPPRLNLIGQITLYLLPAMIIFIFFPAMLFTYFEGTLEFNLFLSSFAIFIKNLFIFSKGWDYTISIYYAFVTLTTIGKVYY